MLTGANDFAQAQGTVLVSDTAPNFSFALDDSSFTLDGGETILNFHVEAAGGSELDPAAVVVRDDLGQPVEEILSADDTGLGSGSVGVFSLTAGDYTVEVPGEDSTTGAFDLTVGLVGDIDGDGDVGSNDREAVRDLRQVDQYQLEADVDLDGIVTAFDYTMARRNLGDSTTHVLLNHSPTADDDSFSTDTFETLVVGSVLDGDSDPDFFNSISVSGYDALSAQGAAVTVQADGTVVYDPVVSSTLRNLPVGNMRTDTDHGER